MIRHNLKQEQLLGLLVVLALHGAALYQLWSYRIIPAPDEAITLMVNLINPPPPQQPRPPKPKHPEPPKLRPPDLPPPEHQHLAVETPVVQPDESVVYVPPPPPPPVIEAPPLSPQPVVLPNELSVSCPERSPPDYPLLSKRRNEQGKVMLRVELGEDGRVANVAVKTSSNYQRLDDAALNAVKTWRCKPSVRNGVAVRAVAMQPFNFMLGDE
ncbi:MAG: energy transducer TonB [Nitrosomonadales bacterium]|nr:energy transducer TonB [Nitrosomonadales bacterium]